MQKPFAKVLRMHGQDGNDSAFRIAPREILPALQRWQRKG
jgi:hypothetical protein